MNYIYESARVAIYVSVSTETSSNRSGMNMTQTDDNKMNSSKSAIDKDSMYQKQQQTGSEQMTSNSSKTEKRYILGQVTKVEKKGMDNDKVILVGVKDISDPTLEWTLPILACIPVPNLIDVNLNQRRLFDLNEHVLAVYPDTTCFYPGKVLEKPTRYKQKYKILFDNDDAHHDSTFHAKFISADLFQLACISQFHQPFHNVSQAKKKRKKDLKSLELMFALPKRSLHQLFPMRFQNCALSPLPFPE
ncbi:hypothetical protein RFI_27668 [Reticulomyxa filosa]|uniref:SGF29 C-terminal domain-containing protein n=1 Tax=Reticulomyxa filosa TaxID=46433 RepID=X6M7T5_RETFI|nr:hypothetical protein RFI_27668 [Reticulomyxa filosa]|eukprot:ETO09711.1 hypothetical protein RFI_27668 [Reticulomyxa filosa]